jgi:hypothetical protein
VKLLEKVTYNGTGRPWLAGQEGTIVALNSTRSSALVDFRHQVTGKITSEWVGLGALKEVNTPLHADTIKLLEDKILEKDVELKEAQNKVIALEQEIKNLSAASVALRKVS